MPDFTYVAYRPIVTRALTASRARALTIGAMELQARFSIGRAIFRWMAAAPIPEVLATNRLGLRFPSPIGVAPHVDLAGSALRLWHSLGAGFTVIGPVRKDAPDTRAAPTPWLVQRLCGIVTSEQDATSDVERVIARLEDPLARQTPVGVSLVGSDITELLERIGSRADFFYVPASEDPAELARWRAATDRPLLVRIASDAREEEAIAATERALDAGLDGVAFDGARSELIPGGSEHGPFLRDRALRLITVLRARFGERVTIVAGAGVMTPEDAHAALTRGADLVQVFEGFVYAGPGLLKRTNRELLREPAPRERATVRADRTSSAWIGVALAALMLVLVGLGSLIVASTSVFLDYELRPIAMSIQEIASISPAPLVPFMAHNRVCSAGALLCLGVIYGWLALVPLRRGEPWAFWTLLISTTLGSTALALALRAKGSVDPHLSVGHASITLLLLISLAFSWRGLPANHRSISSILRPGAAAWLWSPASRGRALVAVWGAGLLLGGLMILRVGVTTTLVQDDVGFLGCNIHEIDALHRGLVPILAKDRILFGAMLFSGGLAALPTIWCGLRPGRRGLLLTLAVAMTIEVGLAVGVHPVIGYNDLTHLAPFMIKAIAFFAGAWLLWGPLGQQTYERRFPDLWIDAGPPAPEVTWTSSPKSSSGSSATSSIGFVRSTT